MKTKATTDQVLLAFLKELDKDTLFHPYLLDASQPDKLWAQATTELEKRNLEVTAEVQQMMTSKLYREECVERVNLDDGRHLLQISSAGVEMMRRLEASIAEERKEAKEDFRWRIGTYIAMASLVSGAVGFVLGWWVGKT